MLNKITPVIFISGLACMLFSCSPTKITGKYYYQHEPELNKIHQVYQDLYKEHPFTIAFMDKGFNILSLEIITDTLTYIYEFESSGQRLTDTLVKYHLNAPKILDLARQMKSIKCIWVNNFDYYVDRIKNSLIFMSVRAVALSNPFSYKKYYILTYFSQPQHFDSEGRLLDKRKLRRLRKINGEVFHRINDKVCYAISERFR